ncbi:SLC13 family permease [Angustibacter sp. Root456]|uniref:SLC13 family permease n=1 Tax=Angustibacter sp. Root456 TaxID=1736539 RepID=UPI0006F6EF59|nr:SLC13 family permease [Angustibacter sp. Root456]KQX64558.1 arsenic transporter [Angustibacter sp. Root456]
MTAASLAADTGVLVSLLDDLAHRVVPVLAFLVAITVVAELSEAAGVFEVAAARAARVARGRVWLLWALVVALSTAATVVLSLDTTAVLLTPVVLTLARRLGVSTAAFAMTTVWLANTASLLLPVSNLTNLLSLHRMHDLGVDVGGFVRLTWLPALAAVVVTVGVLAVMFRQELAGHYEHPPLPEPHDRLLLVLSATVCVLLAPAFVSGVNVAWPAAAAAVLLVTLFAWRDRRPLRWSLLPWRAVALVAVLFTVVTLLGRAGLSTLLATAAGSGEGFWPYLRLAAAGAVTSNGLDNLPAYLALEPAAASPTRLVALLVGVNCGPLVTLWASLATLLWRERCRSAGVSVTWWRFALRGLVVVPLLLLACSAALTLSRP